LLPAMPFHLFAPVPPPGRHKSGWGELTGGTCDDDDDRELFPVDAAMLPPHEMVSHTSMSSGYGAPGKPSSMLEGSGCTQKGHDRWRMCDAMLR
jgi:hypothetical protein